MRTSFHHQPEAQHPIFQLSTSWQADYPIFRAEADTIYVSHSAMVLMVLRGGARTAGSSVACAARYWV